MGNAESIPHFGRASERERSVFPGCYPEWTVFIRMIDVVGFSGRNRKILRRDGDFSRRIRVFYRKKDLFPAVFFNFRKTVFPRKQ